jgi:hypothetical protein
MFEQYPKPPRHCERSEAIHLFRASGAKDGLLRCARSDGLSPFFGFSIERIKARTSFFEKKEAKKLLLLRVVASAMPTPPTNKSFLVLFFKKEPLTSFFNAAPPCPA